MSNQDYFVYTTLQEDQSDLYREQGYLKIGTTLTTHGTELLLQECMTEWEKEKGPFDPESTWLKNSLLADIHKKSEIARQFYFEGPLVSIMQQLIGPNIKGVASQLTFKMRGNTKPFGWHQDNGYGELDPYNAISTLTALEDTDEENGCLRVLPGSHKRGQIDVSEMFNHHSRNENMSIELDVDESQAVPVPMKAGESLIFDCQTFHQSQGNYSKTRDRRILFLRYADADAVEVYNERKPRLGKLLRGKTKFPEVAAFEQEL